MILAQDGGILVTCDSVQNWPNFSGCSLPAKLIMKLMGFLGAANIGPGWIKAAKPETSGQLAADFDRLLEKEFKHLLSGHGVPLRDSAHRDLRATVDRIRPKL